MSKEEVHFNHSIQTSGYLIAHIHWLNKIRKDTKEEDIITSINISISILLCTYVESILNELLGSIIEIQLRDAESESHQRLLLNLKDKLAKASWTQYLEICKVLLPRPLNLYTNEKTWKGIVMLFNLRNIIVHGKEVESKLVLRGDNLSLEYSDRFKKISDYLKEQKVIRSHQRKSIRHKILSTQSTVHFVKTTEKFIDEIFVKICTEQKINSLYMSRSMNGNFLLSHGIDPDKVRPKKMRKSDTDDLPF